MPEPPEEDEERGEDDPAVERGTGGPVTLKGWLKRYGIRGFVGPREKSIHRALYQLNREGVEEFTLKDIMRRAGLEYYDTRDRAAAKSVIKREREVLPIVLPYFWSRSEYAKWAQDGFRDKTKFRKMVECLRALYWFPITAVGSPREAKYRWARMEDIQRNWRVYRDSEITGALRRTEERIMWTRYLPEMADGMAPKRLLADGKHFILPPAKPRYRCTVCGFPCAERDVMAQHRASWHPQGTEESPSA